MLRDMGINMATVMDKLKWEMYRKKKRAIIKYGLKTGKVRPYDKETIERLRSVYYGGIAASVILLSNINCQGRCYDRALLITMGFGDDDFKLVDADVDGITLNPEYIDRFSRGKLDKHYGNHCFAERTRQDGTTWVYDTTMGLMMEKSLYYLLERPKITKVNSREDTINFIEYQDIMKSDISKDRYAAHIILPQFESVIKQTNHFNNQALYEEIELYKKAIDYDGLCREIAEDKKAQKAFYERIIL